MVYLEWFHPQKAITNIESNKKAFITQHNWYYRHKQTVLSSWRNRNTNTKNNNTMERIYELQIMRYYANKGESLMMMSNRPQKESDINW